MADLDEGQTTVTETPATDAVLADAVVPAEVVVPAEAVAPVPPAGGPGVPGGPAGGTGRGIGGASGPRWLLAFGAAGGVLVLTAAAILALGARPTPEALGYIPGDVAAVAELRLDLPGDQLQKVGNLLAHFPGFKDQSTLSSKIDEGLGRVLGSISSGTLDYAVQLKPWLAGPVFAGARLGDSGGTPSAVLVVATTNGQVSCDAVLKGMPTTTETYRGVSVMAASDGGIACALDGRYGLIGSQAMVHAGLDAHADHSGVDGQAAYRAARATIATDQLASIYANTSALSGLGAAPSGVPGLPVASGGIGAALARLPAWAIAGVHAEDDALVVEVVTAPLPPAAAAPGSQAPTAPPAHASRIAPLLPADTTALLEVHGTGIAAVNGLAALRADPTLGGALGQVDTALSVLGGADELVGWIDDLGIVVLPDGASVSGGVVLTAADDATAGAKADKLRGLLSLAALSSGGTSHDTTVNGTTVTTVDLGDVSALLGASGTGLTVPSGTHLILSIAAHGSAVIIGSERFATRLLEAPSGGSLADQAGYKRAMSRATAQNLGQLYLGGASAVALFESTMSATDRPQFEANIKPYVDPIDVVLATVSMENGSVHLHVIASVK